jgi:hypothetical protein
MRVKLLSLLVLLAAALGCAETRSPPFAPVVVFPTKAEVSAIPARSARLEAFGTKTP